MEKLLDEAKAKQVFLEVNSFPERLDLIRASLEPVAPAPS